MSAPIKLPQWLNTLLDATVAQPLRTDARSDISRGILLGLKQDHVFKQVIQGGQADFTTDWRHITAAERALLYAYLNQRGHLEELVEIFSQLFPSGSPPEDLILLDIGCGPFTAGLAFASISEKPVKFDYIGIDRAESMMKLGETLATTSDRHAVCIRTWATNLEALRWERAPGFRPVLIVMSYLLASPTINPEDLADQMASTLQAVSHGDILLIHTNSIRDRLNSKYAILAARLSSHGFLEYQNEGTSIWVERRQIAIPRHLRCAILHRPQRTVLDLQEHQQ